jgi:hypothetical protein
MPIFCSHGKAVRISQGLCEGYTEGETVRGLLKGVNNLTIKKKNQMG